jgi:hypothetical protein
LESYLTGLARNRERRAEFRANTPKQKMGPKPATPEVVAARCARKVEQYRTWAAANRDHLNVTKRAYRAANPDKVRAAYQRRQEDETQRLASAVRSSIRRAFETKHLGSDKNGKAWETILGYTVADLMAHIERQFRGRMSWANFGKWHVDHIVPVASFSFQSVDDPEFRACWALPNLRPLWAKRNRSKGPKRLTLL